LIADIKKNSRCTFFSKHEFYFKTACLFANRIIGNSKAGFLTYGINSRKKCLIYNGVRLERFIIVGDKESIKKSIGVKTKYMVIMTAAFFKRKKYDLFLDVAKSVFEVNQDITFVAVGKGPEQQRILNRIHNETIANVVLLGERNDVEELIFAIDIGLLFSCGEGISNAIIEYMAMSKPVIAIDEIGGTKELVENGVSGFILENNVKKITAKIIELIENAELREKMGAKGREIIENKFTIQKMGEQYIKLYEEELRNSR
jgi:glycosyltransferase involved in cell wall biosynthesis